MGYCLDTDEIWIVLSYGAVSFGHVLNAGGSVSIQTLALRLGIFFIV